MTRGGLKTLSNIKDEAFWGKTNNFQPSTVFAKSFFPPKMFDSVLITPLMTKSRSPPPFLAKNIRSIFKYCTSYPYQYSIELRINMAGNKYK